ncbi:hypothetical protein KA977_07505 [Candidatus Dependentiae bacterium]|nr:hypothetical protein [Candidatus Dependentiae bacterium]
MTTFVKDLSIDEFQHLITETTQNILQEFFDDIQSLSNNQYLESIIKSRADIEKGAFVSFEEAFNDNNIDILRICHRKDVYRL